MTPHVTLWAALAVLALVPWSPAIEDRCDVVEVNHFYDENGRHVFDQLIYWDWSDATERFEVRAWRLLKSVDQWPTRNWRRGDHEAVWFDGERLRVVRHLSLRETWTQFDPELLDREVLPKENRRELGW